MEDDTHRVESREEADGGGCIQREREELLHAHGGLDRREGWTHQSRQEAILTCVTWRREGKGKVRNRTTVGGDAGGTESSQSFFRRPCRQRHITLEAR